MITSLIQKSLGLVNLELRRKTKPQIHETHQLDVLDLCVGDLFTKGILDPFCVVIGAHDGETNDPLCRLIKAHGFPALLIEPQHAICRKLEFNFRNYDKVQCWNVAVSDTAKSALLYKFKNTDDLDPRATQLATLHKSNILNNGHGVFSPLDSELVVCVDFKDIEYKTKREIDILQIDTEGHDYTILNMIPFGSCKPAIIHFENNFMNEVKYVQVTDMLIRHGYKILTLGINTLAYRL